MNTTPNITPFVGPDEWIFFDDFHDFVNSTTAGAARWYFLETAAGATQLLGLTETGGVMELTQTTNDNDVISMIANSGIKVSDLKAGYPVEFGVRFKITDVDDADIHVGLSIQDVSMVASIPADFICFRLLDSEATGNLLLVSSKDSVLSSSTCGAMADATYARAFFKFTPTSTTDIGDIEWEVHTNGNVYRGVLPSAGNFPDDVVIFPCIQFQNGAAAADVASIDWIYAKGTRSWTPGQG